MKPAIATLLADALTSGEYQQTRHKLRDKGCFCVTGVLCDLYRKEVGQGYWDEFNCFRLGETSYVEIPPTEVLAWAGMPESESLHMVTLNDQALTFMHFAERLRHDDPYEFAMPPLTGAMSN